MSSARICLILLALLWLAGCGDNLLPSGEDRRPIVQQGSTGPNVGQLAPDFISQDTGGNSVTLASALAGRKGVVLYFTMWCPICDSHMSNMRSIVPAFPGTGFYLVDYVSGSLADAANAASANGYSGAPFIVLADTAQQLLQSYQATMGSTVVIDSAGVIRMNEDYRDGLRLQAILGQLQ